jgi:hypothetical protein
MKKQSLSLFIPVSKTEIKVLTTEVKETLAKDFDRNQQKVFSSADLWNIQRNKKRNPGGRFLI